MGMIVEPGRRRRSRLLWAGLALLAVGAVAGAGAAVSLGGGLRGTFEVRELTVPVDTSLTLDARDYAVYERVADAPPDTGGAGTDDATPTTMTSDQVTVTTADGRSVEVRPRSSLTERLTVNGSVYVAFAFVTPPAAGTYRVQVAAPAGTADPGDQVVAVNPTLGSAFRSSLPGIGLGMLAALVFAVGLVLTIVGVFRSRLATPGRPGTAPRAAAPAAPGGGIPAGWYPDPREQASVRWWDGSRWTDHVR